MTILVFFSEEASPEILRLLALFAMVFQLLEAPILRNESGFLLAQSPCGTHSRKLQSPGELAEFVLTPCDDYLGFVLYFFCVFFVIFCVFFVFRQFFVPNSWRSKIEIGHFVDDRGTQVMVPLRTRWFGRPQPSVRAASTKSGEN